MKKRRRIGITGPIGSGKSYVAQYLTRWGYPVYDADTRAKRLVEVDSTLRKRIVSLLGEEAYDAQGHYNRRMVASRVFADQSLLAELNALIHPAVLADYEAWCDLASYGTMIFFESALLPRLSWQSYLDAVLVVPPRCAWPGYGSEMERASRRLQPAWLLKGMMRSTTALARIS